MFCHIFICLNMSWLTLETSFIFKKGTNTQNFSFVVKNEVVNLKKYM